MSLLASPLVWQLFSALALAGVMLVAVFTDATQRRIPNKLVLLGVGLGLALNTFGPVAQAQGAGLFSTPPSALGLAGALWGGLVGLGAFMPFYLIRGMGAGDVKLMAAIGCFVGPVAAANAGLFILLAGGAQALATMLWTGRAKEIALNLLLLAHQCVPSSQARLDLRTSAYRMPFSFAIATGLLVYAYWSLTGGAMPIRV